MAKKTSPVRKRSRSTSSSASATSSCGGSSPLTIADFQKHIFDRYYKTDSARGTAATFLWFIEEVGELATALNTPSSQRDLANIHEEFADVFAWLCTLANINQIDLESAIRNKYLHANAPQGHK